MLFILSVTNKLIMLNVIELSVIVLNVVTLFRDGIFPPNFIH